MRNINNIKVIYMDAVGNVTIIIPLKLFRSDFLFISILLSISQ